MSKIPNEFSLAYKKLNPEQRLAVDTIDGPVMVVAGPGTGKTQTLALRIANILRETDTDPSSILALTFTDAAATGMRTRLFNLIGETAYYVTISTFHSFCNEIIKDNPEIFQIPDHRDSLSELAKYKLIEDLLISCKSEKLRPHNAPSLYVSDIIKALSDLKREGVSSEEFADILASEESWIADNRDELKKVELAKRENDLAKNKELQELYLGYQQYLSVNHTFDFEDMINLVLAKFISDPDFRARYQEIYHYFLVDEYQDTNTAQNKIVEQLSAHWGDSANVFVVGDPNQSIMRFQGASLANTLTFLKRYPQATHIKLIENYRSPQFILDAAHATISHNPTAFQLAQLHSQSLSIGKVTLLTSPFESDEIEYLKDKIVELIESGTRPSSIALIYHKNQHASVLAHALSQASVAYRVQGGGDLLEDFMIRQFLNILSTIHALRFGLDDLGLFTILHYPWFDISPLEILKASRLASTSKSSLFAVLESHPLIQKMLTWQEYDATHTLVDFVEHVLKDSLMLNHILSLSDSHIHLARLRTFFDFVKDLNYSNHDLHLEGLLKDLSLMQEHRIKLEGPSFAESGEAVTLTTAHSAKGLEWDHVFIYKCIDGVWGNVRNPKLINLPSSIVPEAATLKAEKNEDERRLFYVALTRAKTSCTITYASEYRKSGKSKPVSPSMFISELGEHAAIVQLASKPVAPSLLEPSVAPMFDDEKIFLENALDTFRLSVTSLNNYLKCPYLFKLDNLIKLPRAKASYLALGTAVHAALEWLYKILSDTSKVPLLSSVLEQFHLALSRELLSKQESEIRGKQGVKILTAYYELYKDEITPALLVEKFFGYGPAKIMVDDTMLTGKIDRIDLLSESDKTIKVVDYKTGKPKTQKEIESSDYKRQLVFYKLLIDLDKNFKYKVGEVQLDFVESPALHKKSVRHNFVITQSEVDSLILEVQEVMKKIRALEFPRIHDLSICQDCDFFAHCYPSGFVAR